MHRTLYKNDYKNCANTKILFDKYGAEKCKISLYEEYPCDNEIELKKREAYLIK